MQFHVGTSGYSYKEWKGTFYPEKFPAGKMLSYYAEHFTTTEMNNTFYRLPNLETVKTWTEQVPSTFRFVLKAPQVITHFKRLKEVDAELEAFLQVAKTLESHDGPLLFQLPPNFKPDLPRLKAFLRLVKGRQVAFEFRHADWLNEETYDLLRTHSCALCLADAEELPDTQLIDTAGWGYIRLRRENYTDADLRKWIKKLRTQPWNETYVFFKHEDTGTGPRFASRILKLAKA